MARKLYRHSRRPASRVIKSESRAHKLHEQNRIRLMCIIVCVGMSFGVLALRLVEVSLIGGGDLPFKRLVSEPHLLIKMEEEGRVLQTADREFPRRKIVDRNGMLLAANVPTACLAVNPKLIHEPKQVAQLLSNVLEGVDAKALEAKLTKPNSSFAYVKRQLTPEEQQAVHSLGIPGLFFEHGMKRVYPMGDAAAHLVGFVNVDNKGLSGVEQYFDKRLRFSHGEEEPLKLSIDMRVQAMLTEELKGVMEKFSAIGAAGLVMDAHTGEMIAMVSLPTFDPHQPGTASADARFNRLSLGTYEMGSTFKTFTMALGLDSGAITMRDGFDTSYPIQIGRFKITDYHPIYRWISVPEIYANSSNIGTVKVVQEAGYEEQVKFYKKLGFDKPVSIELPEKGSPLIPAKWKPVQNMTASFGHGISVTPLHLARAVGAMVNGGTLPDLTLLKRTEKVKKSDQARVIKPETSRDIRELMRLVVEHGTASKARVEGYGVGGKTGTAEKIKNGRYVNNARMSSFVGAFPIDNPRYVVFITADEPKGIKETYGYATAGWVAAPVMASMVERIGPMLGIEPNFRDPNPKEKEFWEASERRNKEATIAFRNRRGGGVHAVSY